MEEFKCPLCKGQYTEGNPPRLLTMCGHTYCHNCIKTFIKRKDYRYSVRCPDDRLTVNIETNSPSHFPKNIAILEALGRQARAKEDYHETNEFLIDNNGSMRKSTLVGESKSSLNELKQGLLGYRRPSLQQGMCLLHLKPLDIVCIEQKIHICAECALFGLHKGHNFTTLKQLSQRNREWSHKITEIIQEKKHIDTKVLDGQIQKQISSILHKKKDLLNEEIDCSIKKIKQKIQQFERRLKAQLEQRIQKLQGELRSIMTIDPRLQKEFQEWTSKVNDKFHQLESSNDSTIVIIDEMDQNMVLQGNMMLQGMKNELIRYWSKVQSVLEYPKLMYSQEIEDELLKLIKFHQPDFKTTKNEELLSMQVTKLEDHSLIDVRKGEPILDEVSLLDISCGFRYQDVQTSHINLSQICLANEPFTYKSSQNLGRSQIVPQPRMKRVKSRELNLNMSLINSPQNSPKKMSYKSPKEKLKTQIFSKKTISSPTSPKAKIRRLVLKVKQPEKFQKVLNSLQSDNIDSIDLTGFQMGDQVAKELCLKIKECKKPKMLRLMKNNLTDESLKEVIGTLKIIDYLNLAQNGFTDKVFDILLQFSRMGCIKSKTVQLGQNKLNSRKFKEKIEDLKKIGIIITL